MKAYKVSSKKRKKPAKKKKEDVLKRMEEIKAKELAKAQVKASIAKLRHEYCTSIPEEGFLHSTFEKPVVSTPASDGFYVREENEIGVVVTRHHEIEIKGLSESVKEGFLSKLPSIPRNLFAQIVSFFRKICKDMKEAEAYSVIYWDKEEEKYFIDVPEHEVSKVGVKYCRNEEYETSRYLTVMEIHSHNTMSGYFSAVDTADEKALRLYGVVGKVNRKLPEWEFRVASPATGKYFSLEISDVFDCSNQRMDSITEIPTVSYPHDEWIKSIKLIQAAAHKIKSVHHKFALNPSFYGGYEGDLAIDHRHYPSGTSGEGAITGGSQIELFDFAYDNYKDLSKREAKLRAILGDPFIDSWVKYGLSSDEKNIVWSNAEDPDEMTDYFDSKYYLLEEEIQEPMDALSNGSLAGHYKDSNYLKSDLYNYADQLCEIMSMEDMIILVGRIISNGYDDTIDLAQTLQEDNPDYFR